MSSGLQLRFVISFRIEVQFYSSLESATYLQKSSENLLYNWQTLSLQSSISTGSYEQKECLIQVRRKLSVHHTNRFQRGQGRLMSNCINELRFIAKSVPTNNSNIVFVQQRAFHTRAMPLRTSVLLRIGNYPSRWEIPSLKISISTKNVLISYDFSATPYLSCFLPNFWYPAC